jgi:hypothetical protein
MSFRHLAHRIPRQNLLKTFTEGLRGERQKEADVGLVPESWEVLKFTASSTIWPSKEKAGQATRPMPSRQ